MTDAAPTACVLIIGDEILSGRTQDANIQYFGQQLAAMGIRLKECRVIPDIPAAIVETLNTVRKLHTYVFTTGGIGPTHDDITTACVAKAFGRKVIRDPKVVEAMKVYYGDKLNEARLQMANIPDGPDVALIENRISVAPGYRIENVFVMAGVPSIARAMFEAVASSLQTGAPVYSQYVDGHVGEGDIADDLVRIQNAHAGVTIGSYPFYRDGKLGTSIVARGTDKGPLASAIAQVADVMRKLNGNPVFGPAP